jgi:hypothetical protein
LQKFVRAERHQRFINEVSGTMMKPMTEETMKPMAEGRAEREAKTILEAEHQQ